MTFKDFQRLFQAKWYFSRPTSNSMTFQGMLEIPWLSRLCMNPEWGYKRNRGIFNEYMHHSRSMGACFSALQWHHNGCDGVSNHQPHDCLLNRLFRHRSKKTSKLRIRGFCEGNSPVTSEFPAQRASNAGNVSIWWSHHEDAYMQH